MMDHLDKRPPLNSSISVKDFKEFYWLKKELTAFCKKEHLNQAGGKIDIALRIVHFLETGERKQKAKKSKPRSTFDWNTGKLELNTPITDNYKSSENVRAFFETNIGSHFKFNVVFMNWIKANPGKTLEDAIFQFEKIKQSRRQNPSQKNIDPQFEYNTYLRDFLAQNPELGREIGIQLWMLKKTRRGVSIYSKEDLQLLDK